MERDLNIEGLQEEDRPPVRALEFGVAQLTAVFAGGFLGALARTALVKSFVADPGHWPWVTFAVNLSAALVLGGFLASLRLREEHPAHQRSFVAVGICGALSTFSTLMRELLRMIDGHHWPLLCGYLLASIAGGLLAVELGGRIASAMWGRR